jgi:hypothetical protein
MLNEIPLGHVSSGCIYYGAGPNGTGFTEEDEPNFSFKQNNCSIYSGIKSLSENLVGKWNKSYVWRLRMPFEEYDNPRNLISKIVKYQKQLRGYCIRCETRIEYNPSVPYCEDCFFIWAQFENPEYEENVCHRCGEYEATSMNKPQDRDCFSLWKKEQK